jgi:hypothetical protein
MIQPIDARKAVREADFESVILTSPMIFLLPTSMSGTTSSISNVRSPT